MTMTLTIIWSN